MLADHSKSKSFQVLNKKSGRFTDHQKSRVKALKASYSEIKSQVQEMIDSGYEDLDILVAIGEKFPRQEVETVLEDLRRKGVF